MNNRDVNDQMAYETNEMVGNTPLICYNGEDAPSSQALQALHVNLRPGPLQVTLGAQSTRKRKKNTHKHTEIHKIKKHLKHRTGSLRSPGRSKTLHRCAQEPPGRSETLQHRFNKTLTL